MLFRTVENIYDSGMKKGGSGAVYGPIKTYKACSETLHRLLFTSVELMLASTEYRYMATYDVPT
jgi:hypothetical protein